jgi:Domain of unknown function (DUF6265)
MPALRSAGVLIAVLGIALAARSLGSSPAPPADTPIDHIGWLAGCLELRDGDRVVEEDRMGIRQGSMLGMSRTTSSKGLAEYELTLIREREGKLLYEAHPSGQEGAVFTATVVSDDSVVFAAPEHDYPQVVGYRRVGADSVLAWIDGKSQGKRLRLDFPYRRVACAGGR